MPGSAAPQRSLMASRNQREGRYVGHGYGKPVRRGIARSRNGRQGRFRTVAAWFARALLRGRLAGPVYRAHLADQQGAQ
jgi:hypothetical protein